MALLQSVVSRITGKSDPQGTVSRCRSRSQLLIEQLAPILELMEQRRLIEVVCLRTGERYQSMILEVNLAERYLELDELFLSRGRHIHLPGERYDIVHHSNGELLRFEVQILEVVNTSRGPLYRVSLPKEISLQQRRQFSRLNLSRDKPLCVKLSTPGQAAWYSTAINLSAGGMRLVVGGNLLDALHPGKRIQNCEFKFTDRIAVSCEASVRGFRFLRQPFRQTEISIEFTDLSSVTAKEMNTLIEHCVKGVEAA